ncbi:hypothetical protein PKB_1296 [Pseudomonas knackmussii B13]|uniref:Uncharacterized protein n=1 Tax=Pseudomonas knackmussii (strain DSM 6978 / CCUG 54928 / LMG 23759 / B13) TaxID=1301098 RepID=A0A024HCU1_PSEKB|nr:hypothetical protein [Pseudomonas knackmussii]CDF82661.1 hypothetical protein PKB_1296 [Pseudomonas knackmussii B13]
MKWLVFWGLVALAGCAVRQDAEPRTVRVEVPVVVPCRTPPVQEPTWSTTSVQKGDSLQLKVRALLAERQQHIGYETQLRAAVQACQ